MVMFPYLKTMTKKSSFFKKRYKRRNKSLWKTNQNAKTATFLAQESLKDSVAKSVHKESNPTEPCAKKLPLGKRSRKKKLKRTNLIKETPNFWPKLKD